MATFDSAPATERRKTVADSSGAPGSASSSTIASPNVTTSSSLTEAAGVSWARGSRRQAHGARAPAPLLDHDGDDQQCSLGHVLPEGVDVEDGEPVDEN